MSATVPSTLAVPSSFFFFSHTATTEIYTLSLHDALPISGFSSLQYRWAALRLRKEARLRRRSEEHTSELQSPYDLVCRLLLEKKKNTALKQSLQVHEVVDELMNLQLPLPPRRLLSMIDST